MNATIEWAMTATKVLESSGRPYTSCANVYVNGRFRFAVYPEDKWNGLCTVYMSTEIDGPAAGAMFHMLPSLMAENIAAISNVFPPF